MEVIKCDENEGPTIGTTGPSPPGQPQPRVRLVWRVSRKRHMINCGG